MSAEACQTPGCLFVAGHECPCGIPITDPTLVGQEPLTTAEREIFMKADAPKEELPEPMEPVVKRVAPPKVGPQLDPTGEFMKDMSPEQLLAEVNATKRDRWLGIFIQLAKSERYLQFVERNYVIQDRIDEEKKQISTVVYENPRAVGPNLTRPQVAKMLAILKTYGTRKPEKVLQELLTTLGQPDAAPTIITGVDETDLKAAIDQSALKKDLD